jgi:hypothetical protein
MEKAALESLDRKGVEQLYIALFKLVGGSPTLKASTSLRDAVQHGGYVVITSGFTIISAKRCETDGPIGAVVIAGLLNKMGVDVAFLTENKYLSLFRILSKAAGLTSFRCLGFPIQEESARQEALKAIIDFSPVAIIAIERPGWNKQKVYHNMSGEDISEYTAKVDYVFNQAHEKGILTIGVGDGGNEIGMGNILQSVIENVPFGSVCRCPCGGGIASVTGADHLVVSSVSNWGAYALAALTASLANMPFEHGPVEERRLIKTAVDAGAVDGLTGKSVEAVDGLSVVKNVDYVKKILEILGEKNDETDFRG